MLRSRSEELRAPSAGEMWRRHTLRTGAASLQLLTLPAAGEAGGHYAVRAVPALRQGGDGLPAIGLALVLDRMPAPAEHDLAPLIRSGVLTLELTVAAPDRALNAFSDYTGERCEPLFARDALLELGLSSDGREEILASAKSSGASPGGALQASLDRDLALDVLGALDGTPSRFFVRCTLRFRAAAPDLVVSLSGQWIDVYQALASRANPDGELGQQEIRAAVATLLEEGRLRLETEGEVADSLQLSEVDPAVSALLRVKAVILERVDEGFRLDDPAARFRLRAAPSPSMPLSVSVASSVSLWRTLTLESTLDQVIGGALDGLDRERFVTAGLVPSPGGNGGGGLERPRRIEPSRNRPRGDGIISLAAAGDSVRSLAGALQPSSRKPLAAALVASDLALPILHQAGPVAGRVSGKWWLDDLIFGKGDDDLPPVVVDSPDAPLWNDRRDARRRWYAPEFVVVAPERSQSPAQAPFGFTIKRTGTTSSGKPALVGQVSFTLRKQPSEATRKAMASMGDAEARAVATDGLSVSLSIPYLDERDNALRRTALPATITGSGDLIKAKIELLNDVARLAYGSLAMEDFQEEPARVEVTYAFPASVPIDSKRVAVVAGGKQAITPMSRTEGESRRLSQVPHFDAGSASFRFPTGEVRLRRELPRETRAASRPRPGVLAASAVALAPAPVMAVATVAPAAALQVATIQRPPLVLGTVLAQLFKRTHYGSQTQLRQQRLDLLVTCELFGGLYQQEENGLLQPLGCTDALKLGQAVVRQYAEATELADPAYRVFRSMQQPGRFLVLPTVYRVTRYAATDPERAYRPAVTVYSSLDLTTPSNNRVVYLATLQPDIPPHLRRRLAERLRSEAASPVIEYPTQVPAEASYEWTVGSALQVDCRVVKAPDHFQVSLATDLAGALLLRTMIESAGVHGVARFRFGDGTVLESSLSLELHDITGPWESGPAEAKPDGNGVLITNRIERPLDVSEVVVLTGDTLSVVPVDARLAPDEERRVPLERAPNQAWAAATPAAGSTATLEEIRSFVEDITTNVIFVDLMDRESHGIEELTLKARLKGVAGTRAIELEGDPPRGTAEFVLPLTSYLADHILEFQVTKVGIDGTSTTTAWLQWDMESAGNVVSLTWELIA